jgi:DNA-binding LytR/AlgR family response regulator
MINCIIADDEILARNVLVNHINKLGNLSIAATCGNGLEVFSALKTVTVDLLFLDIQMPELTGIELLRTLKNPPPVIITTAYSDYAVVGFELNVIDYLLKPISFDRFLKAIDKFETRINPSRIIEKVITQDERNSNEGFLYVKSDKKMVRIMIKDILFIEGLKDYVKIHTKSRPVITHQTLTYFEEKLAADQFIRVHRSYIVSTSRISAYSSNQLEIGNTIIPIGITYTKDFLRKMVK